MADNNPIKVLLDSLQAVQALRSGRSRSSLGKVGNFVKDCQKVQSVEIRWIPGHPGIEGNEMADKLAKATLIKFPNEVTNEALPMEVPRRIKFTFASLNILSGSAQGN